MALSNIQILPITNMAAHPRAIAISQELFRVKRPISTQNDIGKALLQVEKHPTQDIAVIMADLYDVISVHPDNNLSGLIALFPDLPPQELAVKSAAIANATAFRLIDVLPSTHILLTNQQLKDGGWFEEIPFKYNNEL